jgi:signal transduction histidine kinase
MVGDLLDYSRPLQPALSPVELLPLLVDAIEAARAVVPEPPPGDEPREVDLRVPADLTVRADLRLLRQALLNLFVNGFQAMPRGGVLHVIATRRDDGHAQLTIKDSGAGIPPEASARIFQPFFTTKATGTGLGLAVVKRIIEGHGGRITLVPSPTGAEFELALPVA